MKKKKKLALSRETVSSLITRQLTGAGGAFPWNTHSCGPEGSICFPMDESMTC
ncbi:MAG TPA: class I lanthipeptide [Thermoanaerobaculia bacterium]|nr:class I lanthipeptide [Thermoanaerobaculia bacterium]